MDFEVQGGECSVQPPRNDVGARASFAWPLLALSCCQQEDDRVQLVDVRWLEACVDTGKRASEQGFPRPGDLAEVSSLT